MLKDVIAARLHSSSGQAGMSADKDAIRNALTDAKVKFYWEEMLEAVQVRTSKTRFYKLPAAAKVFLGLSNIEGKGKTISERSESLLNNSENLEVS